MDISSIKKLLEEFKDLIKVVAENARVGWVGRLALIDRTLYDKTFRFIEGFRDDGRDRILNAVLISKLAIADVGRLRSLALNYSSEEGGAGALARILMACSHPELIEKKKESEDDNER
jgi:hypothetical protein